ncbi:hypothetical protein FEK35_30680 [Nocardia cyriacigeorgica]|uniref:DNA-directed RNA polymerase subunit beta n=1 Tax=Nocardia cyriacigeorgica TaxID=135487 RepID=A0A5R8P4M1_9NOCA|nr:hypothetical protein [Nocardia cyriacigeorgica]TLF92306.1 hypothetical protein FEK35_30680 [Nocardia cyriacigeorgica]
MILATCYSIHEVAFVYRQRYGLPVDVAGGRPSIITSGDVGAVVMPQEVGRLVHEELSQSSAYAVPVLTHPRHHPWVFLVRPDRINPAAAQLLSRHGISIVDTGKRVWLPKSDSHADWYLASAPGIVRAGRWMLAPARSRVLGSAKSVIAKSVATRSAGGTR